MTYIECLRKLGYLVLTPGNKLIPAQSYLIRHWCNKTMKMEDVSHFNEFHEQVVFTHFGDDKLDTNRISVYKNISNSDEREQITKVL